MSKFFVLTIQGLIKSMQQQEVSHRQLHNNRDKLYNNHLLSRSQVKLNHISVSTSRKVITKLKSIKHILSFLVSSPTTPMREMIMTIMVRRNSMPLASLNIIRRSLNKVTISLRSLNTPRLRLMRKESSTILIMNDIFYRHQNNQVNKMCTVHILSALLTDTCTPNLLFT